MLYYVNINIKDLKIRLILSITEKWIYVRFNAHMHRKSAVCTIIHAVKKRLFVHLDNDK